MRPCFASPGSSLPSRLSATGTCIDGVLSEGGLHVA